MGVTGRRVPAIVTHSALCGGVVRADLKQQRVKLIPAGVGASETRSTAGRVELGAHQQGTQGTAGSPGLYSMSPTHSSSRGSLLQPERAAAMCLARLCIIAAALGPRR